MYGLNVEVEACFYSVLRAGGPRCAALARHSGPQTRHLSGSIAMLTLFYACKMSQFTQSRTFAAARCYCGGAGGARLVPSA